MTNVDINSKEGCVFNCSDFFYLKTSQTLNFHWNDRETSRFTPWKPYENHTVGASLNLEAKYDTKWGERRHRDKLAPFITTADFSVSMCELDCACVCVGVYVCVRLNPAAKTTLKSSNCCVVKGTISTKWKAGICSAHTRWPSCTFVCDDRRSNSSAHAQHIDPRMLEATRRARIDAGCKATSTTSICMFVWYSCLFLMNARWRHKGRWMNIYLSGMSICGVTVINRTGSIWASIKHKSLERFPQAGSLEIQPTYGDRQRLKCFQCCELSRSKCTTENSGGIRIWA